MKQEVGSIRVAVELQSFDDEGGRLVNPRWTAILDRVDDAIKWVLQAAVSGGTGAAIALATDSLRRRAARREETEKGIVSVLRACIAAAHAVELEVRALDDVHTQGARDLDLKHAYQLRDEALGLVTREQGLVGEGFRTAVTQHVEYWSGLLELIARDQVTHDYDPSPNWVECENALYGAIPKEQRDRVAPRWVPKPVPNKGAT